MLVRQALPEKGLQVHFFVEKVQFGETALKYDTGSSTILIPCCGTATNKHIATIYLVIMPFRKDLILADKVFTIQKLSYVSIHLFFSMLHVSMAL